MKALDTNSKYIQQIRTEKIKKQDNRTGKIYISVRNVNGVGESVRKNIMRKQATHFYLVLFRAMNLALSVRMTK